MKLYTSPFCPFSRKLQIILEEKKVPYQIVSVDAHPEGAAGWEFVALHPFAKVPVLVDGDVVLFESDVIGEYLEELYPDPPLLPVDAAGKGRVRLIARIHDNELGPRLRLLSDEYFAKKPGERDDRFIADTFRRISEDIRWFDQQLLGRPFFGGDFFSIADAALVPTFLNLLPQFNVDMTSYTHLAEWSGRVRKRPSVKKSDPGAFRQIPAIVKGNHDRSNPSLKKVRAGLGG